MTRQFEDKPQRRANDRNSDHDCAYEANGMRCRYPGAIGFGGLGGGPCYCRIHIREQGNAIAWQALERSQDYGKRADPQPNDDLAELTWNTENFAMMPIESRDEYNMRCRDKALAMGKVLRLKSVMNVEPVRMREPGEDWDEA